MKFWVKSFFKVVRVAMHPVMLFWEWITTPKGIKRDAASQQAVDQESRSLVLYQFKTCPFCIRVRREIRRLSLPVEMRDAQKNLQHRAALLQGGGQVKVPCLRITAANGGVQWLYESAEINRYLHQRFGAV